MFSTARQAEIIRSNQKDEYYSGFIKSSLADITQGFFGPRSWIRWRQEMDVIADAGYLALTTLAGLQTLGEEYVNMIQVDGMKRAIPTEMQRVCMILLQVGAPYLLNRLLGYLETELRQNASLQLDADARQKLLSAIPVMRHVITVCHRCHLALFYMRGAYYHIAKRLTGINYILVRSSRQDVEGAASNYRLLGWLSVIQLSVTFLQQLYKWYQLRNTGQGWLQTSTPDTGLNRHAAADQSEASVDPGQRCSLCLEPRRSSTATPCGHIFCWTCIAEWASTKAECPLCRDKFEMSRLIPLQNYDPT